jgi:hypothetical protein
MNNDLPITNAFQESNYWQSEEPSESLLSRIITWPLLAICYLGMGYVLIILPIGAVSGLVILGCQAVGFFLHINPITVEETSTYIGVWVFGILLLAALILGIVIGIQKLFIWPKDGEHNKPIRLIRAAR